MATKKITDLTNVTSVQDTDLLIIETSEGTRSVKKSDFVSSIVSMIKGIVIPTKLSELADDSTHRLVTDTEKSMWNAKIDWDSITNKPFGIENFSNTVTWDGDITDATQHGYFYQISDVIPTYDDFLNGYTIVVAYNDTKTVVTVSAANASNNISVSPDGTYFICGGGGMTDLCVIALKTNNSIQKTGIYFYYANNSGNILYTKSLTINDYQGFPGAIKKIDKMYLPDILTEADVQTIVNNTFSNAEEVEF